MKWSTTLLTLSLLGSLVDAIPAKQEHFQAETSLTKHKHKHKHHGPHEKGGIAWDENSLIIDGERIVLWSGEFHPWRLPVPSLWLDVLQKIKALGFNAISFYSHWGLNNPANGTLDFEGFRDYQPFLDACMQAGLWVVARPGPYINAETTGGGIPGWVLASDAKVRTNDPHFEAAWKPYWQAIGELCARNQWDEGGPVIMVQIENEYFLNGKGDMDLEYIKALEKSMIDAGVKVPLSFNDVGMKNRLVKGPGHVDLYGFDSYPQSLDWDACGAQEWRPVDERYHDYFASTAGKVGVPYYIPEFQGGTINQWTMPIVEDCQRLFGAEFERVFYLHNLASGVKMHNVYMVYGGTNWGGLAFPPSTTTYDYFAAIREDRTLREPKYSELKVISHFLRSARDYPDAHVVGKWKVEGQGSESKESVLVTELENKETRGRFYIVRQVNSSSLDTTEFKLQVRVGSHKHKTVTLPKNGQLALNGRDSRIIATGFNFGKSRMAYCTARIMLATTIGQEDIVLVYGDEGEHHEIAFDEDESMVMLKNDAVDDFVLDDRVMSFQTRGRGIRSTRMKRGKRDMRVLVADTETAYATWQPVLRDEASEDPREAFYRHQDGENVVVVGPYLVRDAVRKGKTLNIAGDLSNSVSLLVFAPPDIESVLWNGQDVGARKNDWSAWAAELVGPETLEPIVTDLASWRYADSLPEVGDFDDSDWVDADHTSTDNLHKPYKNYEGKSVLYAEDYGYHQGNLLFRGHFNATGRESRLDLSLSPGRYGAGSVWLNGRLLGSGNVPIDKIRSEDVNVTFALDSTMIRAGQDNVILVLTDHMGYEEAGQFTDHTDDVKSPRGVRGYSLVGGGEIAWKIQGNLGGNWAPQDQLRSMLNEGGLFAERQGWHLSDFDSSSWPVRDIFEGPGYSGVGFHRSTFNLSVPAGIDLSLSVVYSNEMGPFRSQVWVNGWMMGKRVGSLGPQLEFPVPPGVLVNGTNSIAVSYWSLEVIKDTAPKVPHGPRVVVSHVTKTGYDMEPVWQQYV